MTRVLVKTEARGWYVDAADPSGGKVRKEEGDQIFDGLLEAQEALAVLTKAHGPEISNGHGATEEAESKEVKKEVAEKPKTASKPKAKPKSDKPKTTVIKCAWVEGAENDGTPYETIKLASGKTIKGLSPAKKAKAHGKERTIKVQDQFQVRYCEEHQEEHRKALRRVKARARTAAKKAAKA